MKIELDVIDVTLLTGDDMDIVFLHIAAPSPFPLWLPEMRPILKLEVQQGYGETFVQNVFKLEPYRINKVAI